MASANAMTDNELEQLFTRIQTDARVRAALDFLKADEARTLTEQKAITEIAAPPFKEHVRADDFCKRLVALGLEDAHIDHEGNVIAIRRGMNGGLKLVVSAHLDTVFPEGTDVSVKERDGRLHAPGIGDDTRGVAELLSIVRALDAARLCTIGDVYFVATVGEEGLGDLRGVKALFHDHADLDGFISIDGAVPERITYLAVASRRYRATFQGSGGHSFNDFGRPSAIHAMGRAIATVADLRAPDNPRTTFTVGTVRGGTSINAIASEAVMEVDMRSLAASALQTLEGRVLEAIDDAVAEENDRWSENTLRVNVQCVGDRPGGAQSLDALIVRAAVFATNALGLQPDAEEAGSTDSNLPVSLGIPAVTIGRGGRSGGTHTLQEWYDPTNASIGPQRDLVLILALAGVDGVSEPLLQKH